MVIGIIHLRRIFLAQKNQRLGEKKFKTNRIYGVMSLIKGAILCTSEPTPW